MHTHSAVIVFLKSNQPKVETILAKHGACLDGTWNDEGSPPEILTGQVVQCNSTHDTRMGIALAELESVIGYNGIQAAYDAHFAAEESKKIHERCY